MAKAPASCGGFCFSEAFSRFYHLACTFSANDKVSLLRPRSRNVSFQLLRPNLLPSAKATDETNRLAPRSRLRACSCETWRGEANLAAESLRKAAKFRFACRFASSRNLFRHRS